MLNWIIQNKELLKIIYAFAIVLICFVIVLRTNKLFKLSSHQGIRYFRNAFFFYGFGFFIRYILGTRYLDDYIKFNYFALNVVFEFFLIMAGFFLIYSLLWKKFETTKQDLSSLLNGKIFIFYLMAILIAVLDYLWMAHYWMFLSQIIIFAIAVVISFSNYQKKGHKGKFLRFYFLAMVLSFVAWVLNFSIAFYLNWSNGMLMIIYVLNIILFLLFLFGVIKITGDK